MHSFNPSTWEVEAGGCLRPAWSIEGVQDSQSNTEKPSLQKPNKKVYDAN